MSDHEREINDDLGLSDEVIAIVRPPTVHVVTSVHRPTVSSRAIIVSTAQLTADAEVIPAPRTTTMGYEVTKTYTIHETEEIDGVRQYELLDDDEFVWVGCGDDRVESFLNIIMRITGQEPEIPDN